MNERKNFELQVASKTTDQLLVMVGQPDDWLPEALDVAVAELRRRGVNASSIIPSPTPTGSTTRDLGNLVFSTRCECFPLASILGAVIFGSAATFLMFALPIHGLSASEWLSFLLVGLLGLFLGGGILWLVELRTPRFRVHEYGVRRIKGKSQITLYFDQIGRFTYDATRFLLNGAYTHTTLNLQFEPIDRRRGAIAVTVNYRKRRTGEGLGKLRECLAIAIADRMERQLQEGRSVIWTSSRFAFNLSSTFVFHPSGLQIRIADGNASRVTIPFDKISGYNVLNGVLHLYSEQLHKPASLNASATNFYPGCVLLFRLANIPTATFSFWEKFIGTR